MLKERKSGHTYEGDCATPRERRPMGTREEGKFWRNGTGFSIRKGEGRGDFGGRGEVFTRIVVGGSGAYHGVW